MLHSIGIRLSAIGLCLLLLARAAGPMDASAKNDKAWIVGQPAPHVHLPNIANGKAVDLADFRGRRVLLLEFASW